MVFPKKFQIDAKFFFFTLKLRKYHEKSGFYRKNFLRGGDVNFHIFLKNCVFKKISWTKFQPKIFCAAMSIKSLKFEKFDKKSEKNKVFDENFSLGKAKVLFKYY